MAKSGKGNQGLLLLVLVGILIGGGTWNFRRNLAIEEAEPRPYRGYSLEQLEDLKAAYENEVDTHTQRYQQAASRKVNVRGGGMLRDQVDEFERVQRIGQKRRAIASDFAKNQVQLDDVKAELRKRETERDELQLFVRRLTKYP
jgi:hypothetical protein